MAEVTVTKDRYTVEPLYQWDLNQELVIKGLSLPSIPEIHFTNASMSRALVRQSSMNSAGVITVKVPNSLLQKPHKITAYVCIDMGGEFKSLYSIDIPVKARNKPDDYTWEDSEGEIYSFNALENMVANALDKLESDRADTLSAVKNATNEAIDTLQKNNESFANELETNNDATLRALSQELINTFNGFIVYEDYDLNLRDENGNSLILETGDSVTAFISLSTNPNYIPISATVIDGRATDYGISYTPNIMTETNLASVFVLNSKPNSGSSVSGKLRVVYMRK